MERHDAVERAAAVVPMLREVAPAAEADRRMADSTMAALVDAGMFKLVQPGRFGGEQVGAEVFVQAMIEIARGDGSAGWVTSLTSAHTKWAGFYPLDGQEEMYGDDGDLRFPLVVAPQGKATPTDGGYLVTGQWDYASGCDLCNWLGVNAVVPGEGVDAAPAGLVSVVIAADEYDIVDNWHVDAMAGTGSKRAVLDEVFVPDRRAIRLGVDGEPVKRDVLDGADEGFFRAPMLPLFACELGAVAVGIGRAFVEHFVDRAMVKTSPFPPFGLLRDTESVQSRLGETIGDVDRAERALVSVARDYDRFAAAGADPTEAETRRMLLAVQGVVGDVCTAVERLGTTAGTSMVKTGEPLMRAWRDLIAVRTHYLLGRDRTANDVGRIALGLDRIERN